MTNIGQVKISCVIPVWLIAHRETEGKAIETR